MTATTTHRTTGNLLTPQAAANLAGCHVRSLPRWVARGWLTDHRTMGGHHRYDQNEIQAWIDASPPQTVQPPRDPGLPPPDLAHLIDGDPTPGTCPTCGQDIP